MNGCDGVPATDWLMNKLIDWLITSLLDRLIDALIDRCLTTRELFCQSATMAVVDRHWETVHAFL